VTLERESRAWPVRARYVLGSDGARSRVARDLGLDENREWIVGVEDVLGGVPLAGPPCFHCFLDPRLAPGYLAWVLQDGEETEAACALMRLPPFDAIARHVFFGRGSFPDVSDATAAQSRAHSAAV